MKNNVYSNPYDNKLIKCSNCGASIDKTEAQCPFCKTMQYEAANKKYMGRLYRMNNEMNNLDNEGNANVLKNTLIACGICVALIILTVAGCFATAKYRYKYEYNDANEDKEAREELIWYDENYQTINDCYDKQDFEGIMGIIHKDKGYSIPRILKSWEHYSLIYVYDYHYSSFEKYAQITDSNSDMYKRFGYEYAIEYLYFVNALTDYNSDDIYMSSMSDEDRIIIDGWNQKAIDFLNTQLGIPTEQIIEEINYIYQDSSKKYERMKEMSERYEVC